MIRKLSRRAYRKCLVLVLNPGSAISLAATKRFTSLVAIQTFFSAASEPLKSAKPESAGLDPPDKKGVSTLSFSLTAFLFRLTDGWVSRTPAKSKIETTIIMGAVNNLFMNLIVLLTYGFLYFIN